MPDTAASHLFFIHGRCFFRSPYSGAGKRQDGIGPWGEEIFTRCHDVVHLAKEPKSIT